MATEAARWRRTVVRPLPMLIERDNPLLIARELTCITSQLLTLRATFRADRKPLEGPPV